MMKPACHMVKETRAMFGDRLVIREAAACITTKGTSKAVANGAIDIALGE